MKENKKDEQVENHKNNSNTNTNLKDINSNGSNRCNINTKSTLKKTKDFIPKNVGVMIIFLPILLISLITNIVQVRCTYGYIDMLRSSESKIKEYESQINEKISEIDSLNAQISKDDTLIDKLNKKVESVNVWFELNEEQQKTMLNEMEKLKAEEQARIEAELKAKAEEEARRAEEIRKAEEEARKAEEERKINQSVNTNSIESRVRTIIKYEISNSLEKTTLDSLTVNENIGTESNKDVIVLVNLSWSRKNTEWLTREMLEMYSDHLAVKISSELADGSEIVLFWDAEYTGLNIKHSYYVENGNAYKQ